LDNVTHSLTGLFLSHAGLNRFTPNATILLVLAANAPDIDILMLAGGGLNYFHFHRHLTHSLFFSPLLGFALLCLFQLGLHLLRRPPIPWLAGFFVAMAGIGSHLLLDLTNNYGERLLLPFDGRWLAADICAIYDLGIFIVFFFCLAAPLLSKLVGGEIGGSRQQKYPSRFFPILALLFLVIYDGARYTLHERALAMLDARQYDGTTALRVAAFPDPVNPFLWKGVAESATAYRVYDLNLLGSFDPASAQPVFKLEENSAIRAASQTEAFRVMRDFSRFPLFRVIPVEDGTQVLLGDLRFAFNSEAVLDRSGKVVSAAFHFSR
jgi:inner membrane protein